MDIVDKESVMARFGLALRCVSEEVDTEKEIEKGIIALLKKWPFRVFSARKSPESYSAIVKFKVPVSDAEIYKYFITHHRRIEFGIREAHKHAAINGYNTH